MKNILKDGSGYPLHLAPPFATSLSFVPDMALYVPYKLHVNPAFLDLSMW